jgi:hypothetical protein
MTIALCVIIAVLFAERFADKFLLDGVLKRHAFERKELAERIQHPEIRYPEVIPSIPHEQSSDGAEMAYVGDIVPEFLRVGSGD